MTRFSRITAAVILTVLLSAVSLLPANAYGVSDWIAGCDDVTITEVADGIQVSSPNMSYMSDDEHTWNGVASANKYKLDGLKLVYTYTDIAEIPAGSDCWICISFMNKPYPFVTTDNSDNQGYANLCRYSGNYDGNDAEWHHIEALGSFGEAYTDPLDFAFAPGTQVTMECKLVDGEYNFILNGNECSSGFPDLVPAFPDGTAHIVIKNYYSDGEGNGFTMVLNSINGEALTTPAAEISAETVPSDDAAVIDTAPAVAAPAAAQSADPVLLAVIAVFGSAMAIGRSRKTR
ncbi:MAG: hypothetical protein PHZ09_14510 [Eubacteriales bacterium]|nr:hypothetical protein [Eubacteriales bacterium]